MNQEDLALAGSIGAFLPLVISLVIQTEWSTQFKSVSSFIICLVFAMFTSFLSNEVALSDPNWNWITWFGAMYLTAETTYKGLWKPTKIAPKIENNTNL